MAQQIEFAMADISTADIVVDSLGQRDVNRRQAQFKKIMKEFNPALVQPVSVAMIDGKYHCIDGQMTMKVLKARNRGRDLKVKCRIYYGLTKMDAAKMFTQQRGTVSAVSQLDKIWAGANYGEKQAMDFLRITENNGLYIARNGIHGKNIVVAVSTLWKEYLAMDDNNLYAEMIRIIKKAWDGDPAGCRAEILRGLGLFLRTYKKDVKEASLIEKLSKKHPMEIIRDAQVDRSPGARKYAQQILQIYNYGLREGNRLPYRLC